MTWTPRHFIVIVSSGWMNRQQQEIIDYVLVSHMHMNMNKKGATR